VLRPRTLDTAQHKEPSFLKPSGEYAYSKHEIHSLKINETFHCLQ